MSSAYGPEGPSENESIEGPLAANQTMECQLFESLVHHLFEKGVLTRNDALSVVQTVAQGIREIEKVGPRNAAIENELTILNQLYKSFELLPGQPPPPQLLDGKTVIRLRPPLHSDRPKLSTEN